MSLSVCVLNFYFLVAGVYFLQAKPPGNGAVLLERAHHQVPQHELAGVEVVMDVR